MTVKLETVKRQGIDIQCINGMWIPVKGSRGLDRFMYGTHRWLGKVTYQMPSLVAAIKLDKRRTCAVDVGAHIGLWSRVFSQLYGQVIAVEPLPAHLVCLQLNAPGDNVRIVASAISDCAAPSEALLELDLDKGLMNRLATGADAAKPTISVVAQSLDSIVPESADVSLIKADVEGGELLVVRGAGKTIDRCRPVICLEQKDLGKNYRPGEKQYAALEHLKAAHGYKVAGHVRDDWYMVPA